MHPVLAYLELGGAPRPLGAYGLMLALAILVGGAVAVRGGTRADFAAGDIVALVGFAAGGGLLGGFCLFVAVELGRGQALSEVLAQGGGLVFYGAPLGGLAAVFAACRALGLPFARVADATVLAVPVAHALGRVGCFLGGCCFGAPFDGPWAVRFTHALAPAAHPSVPRHPSQLYEVAGLLALALIFARWPAGKPGHRALSYVAAYALLRFVVEAFRGDAVRGFVLGGLMSTSQAISLLLGGLALAALWLRGRRSLEVSAQ